MPRWHWILVIVFNVVAAPLPRLFIDYWLAQNPGRKLEDWPRGPVAAISYLTVPFLTIAGIVALRHFSRPKTQRVA